MRSTLLLVLLLLLCFTAIGFAQLNIVIDGKKDAFYETLTGPSDGYLAIPYTANIDANSPATHPVPESNADLSASVWTAWDETYFYIYAEVNDDTVAHTNSTDWQNDMMEIKVDPDPSRAATTGMLSFNTSAFDSASVPANLLGGISYLKYDNGTHHPENIARKVFSNGYIIEERIPWADMAHSDGRFVDPLEGNTFGAGINFHENENTTGRVGSVAWSSSLDDRVWTDPSLAGSVTFLADNKLLFDPVSPISGASVHADPGIYDPANWPDIPTILDKQEDLITIDGFKDAFYQTLTGPADGYLVIPFTANIDANSPATHPVPESNLDLSASVWTAWDETYFYIYAEVHDDTVAHTNSTDWQNDMMEIKVDPDPSRAATSGMLSFNTTAYDSASVPANLLGGISYLKYDNGTHHPENIARRRFVDGYILEEKIPWADMVHSDGRFVDPQVDNVFGVGINFHENENTTGRVGSVAWSSSLDDRVWTDPSLAGTVQFLADNKLLFDPVSPINGSSVHADPGIYDPANNPDLVALVITSVTSNGAKVPGEFMLTQNYPNPFNPETNIRFNLPEAEKITLTIFNINGQKIADLVVGERRDAGSYEVKWNGKDQFGNEVASGLYVYRLKAGNVTESKKMMLIK